MSFGIQLLIICPLVFLAGFIDSVAGGGGLISTPAYMLAGLPMHNVLATNKVMSSVGTGMAAVKFAKSGHVHWKTAVVSLFFSASGSFLGSQLALAIDQTILKTAFTIVLPFIAIFVLLNKKSAGTGQKLFGRSLYAAAAFIGVLIGMYDGLIGPGTGTFLIFAYTTIIGFDYITASGNAKIVNLASNITAAASYILAGKVLWAIAIPAAAANLAGNYLGSSYAINKGSDAIRKMLILVLAGIFIKLILDII